MVTIWDALERNAERSVETRNMWRQAIRQRRTEFTDIYGVPYPNEANSKRTHEYHIGIPLDLAYYERFQFKLYVDAANAINPETFKFYMGDPATPDTSEIMIDLTDYLEEQQGEWVTGDGYFPSESIDDRDEAGSFYDILDACGLVKVALGDDAVNTILRPGNKLIRITSTEDCDVLFIPYFKCSTVNR